MIWNLRAIAVERYYSPESAADKDPESRNEAGGQTFAFLRDDFDLRKPTGQISHIGRTTDDRERIGGHRMCELYGVLNQALVRFNDCVGRKAAGEPGLHVIPSSRLRHYDERASVAWPLELQTAALSRAE